MFLLIFCSLHHLESDSYFLPLWRLANDFVKTEPAFGSVNGELHGDGRQEKLSFSVFTFSER